MNSPSTTTKIFNLFDQFSGSILVSDEKGVIQYVNTATQKRTGYYRAQMVGSNPGNLWGGAMEKDFYAHMWKALHVNKPVHTVVKNIYKNASSSDEYLNILPIFEGGKKYFIEIHPKNISAHDIPHMQKDFEDMTNGTIESEYIFEKISFWLSGGRSVNEVFLGSARTFFEEQLLEPLRKTLPLRSADRKMITRAQKDPEKFERLYDMYYQDIFKYVLSRLSYQHEHAQDLTHEVFEKAFRHIDSFALRNASYRTYLLRIAHNELVNEYRKKHPVTLFQDEYAEQSFSARHDRKEALEEALKSVSDIERKIIVLKYFEELSVREIATALGKTENAVKLHLSRARKKLRQNNRLKEELI